MIDFRELALETIQSQYGASPHLKGIVKAFAEQIDPNGDIGLFFDKIFNLDFSASSLLLCGKEAITFTPGIKASPEKKYFPIR